MKLDQACLNEALHGRLLASQLAPDRTSEVAAGR